MEKSLWVMAILVLTTLMLSGCLWVPVDDGYSDGNSHGRDRGERHGERHDNRGDRR